MARGNIKGITIELNGDTTSLDKSLSGINASIKNTAANLKAVDQALKLDPGNTELVAQKQRLLAEQVENTRDKLEQLTVADEQAKKQLESGELGQDDYDALQREIIKTEASLRDYEDQLAASNETEKKKKKSLDEIGDSFKETGEKISDTGEKLTKGVTVPILAIGAAAAVAWGEYDDAVDGIITATGATGEAAEEMEESFRAAFGALPAESQMVGAAVGELNTQFDLTGEALTNATEKSVKFATINNTDVTKSIQSAKGVMSALNMDTSQYGKVLDAVTKASQKTGVQTDKLFDLVEKGAPQLNALGLSFEESALFLGQMEQAGLDSSRMLGGLTKAQVAAAKEGKDLGTILSDFTDYAGSGASQTEKLALAAELFGTKNGPAMLQAAQQGVLDFEALAEAAGGAAGTVEETFDATLDPVDNLQIALNNIKLAGADLFTSIQEAGAPALEELAGKAQDLAKWFGNLNPETQSLVIKLGAAALATGPLLTGIGHITSGMESAITAVGNFKDAVGDKGLGGAIGGLVGPGGKIMLAVAAIAALVAIGKKIKDELEPGTEEIRDLITASQEMDETFKETENSIKTNAKAAREIVDELKKYERQVGLTVDEQRKMQALIDQLNDIYPELNLNIDDQTGLLSESTTQLEKRLLAMEKELLFEAYRDRQLEQIKERIGLEDELEAAQTRVAEAQDKVNKKNDGYLNGLMNSVPLLGDARMAITDWGSGLTDAEQDVVLLIQAIEDKNAEIDRTAGKMAVAGQAIDEYADRNKSAADSDASSNQIRIESNDKYIDTLLASYAAERALRDEYTDDIEAYHDEIARLNNQNLGNIQSFADKEFKIAEASAADLKKHQEKTLAAYLTYESNMAILSKKVPADVLEEIRKLGVDGAPIIQEYVNMTDKELQPYIDTWSSITSTAMDTALQTASTMPGATAQIAIDTVNELQKELKKAPPKAQDAMDDTVRQYADTGTGLSREARDAAAKANKDLETELHKGKEKARKAGTDTTASYASGIESVKEKAKKAGSNVSSSARSGMTVTAYADGQNVGQTFANGILSKVSVVKGAGATLGNAAPTGLKNVLQIKSPSRVMGDAADDTVDGYVYRLEDRVKDVQKAGQNLVEPMAKLATNGIPMPAIAASLPKTIGLDAGSASGLSGMYSLLQQYLPRLLKLQMVLDSGTLVGAIAPAMDQELGAIAEFRNRGI